MDFKFTPLPLSTVTVVASSSGGSAPQQVYPTTANTNGTYPITLRVSNNSTAPVYLEAGSSTVSAMSSASMPIRPTSELLMSLNGLNLWVSGMTSAGAGTLQITPGKGL